MAERRAASTHRFDTIYSPHYDENWGAVSPSHAAFVARLVGLVRQDGGVLDAACGTGKYWPALLAAGLRITGVDQSAGMLSQARRKYPEVPSRVLVDQAPAYVTVELPDEPLPPPTDPRQVPGEVADGGGYHYYPPRDQVRRWLAAIVALTLLRDDGRGERVNLVELQAHG